MQNDYQIQMHNRRQNMGQRVGSAKLSRCQSSQRLKFKEVLPEFNELNSKYELYRCGTPNTYSQDIEKLKASSIRNDVHILSLPGIEYIIDQMAKVDAEGKVNQRNYQMCPTGLPKANPRYKDMLSEKQEIRDFILWFEGQYQSIEQSTQSPSHKFHEKQTLIAAGFTDMAGHVAKVSKSRSQILKMLWNRENSQVTAIVQSINEQNVKKEKELLQSISNLHRGYQEEIEGLRRHTRQLQEQCVGQKEFGRSCVGTMRVLRRRIKKTEYLVKKLGECNLSVKKENLHLMQENIRLLMGIKEISQEEAVILNYRKLQISRQKDTLGRQKNKELIRLAQGEETLTPLQDFQQKKDELYSFFIQRMRDNPDEKAMIREEYFVEDEQQDHASIEDYFRTIINQPNVQTALLTQPLAESSKTDAAVNTEPLQEPEREQSVLSFEKGIQVEECRQEGEGYQRRFYQIMDEKQEELIDRDTRRRLQQHKQSRRNSLTLLELERLNQVQSKHTSKPLHEKRGNLISSGFAKKVRKESRLQRERPDQELASQSSSSEDNIASTEVTRVASRESCLLQASSRKSRNLNPILPSFTHDGKGLFPEQAVRLEGEETIKYSQLQDLIRKHLAKNQEGRLLQNPEKSLNKVLLALFRNASHHPPSCFTFQLLEVVKTSYGNTKSVMWKFLTVVSMVHGNQTANSLLKVSALLLRVSDKYKMYDAVNGQQLCGLYFKLFFLLSIKAATESSFNLWKACTSLQKIKGLEFVKGLQMTFGEKKCEYIVGKIEEFVAVSQGEGRTAGEGTRTPVEEAQIVKLNPLLLYVLEVYLIEKQLFQVSYCAMADFLSEDGAISFQIMLWLIDVFGFDQPLQREISAFTLSCNRLQRQKVKLDVFYRCCVRYDLPLMEQVEGWTYSQFRLLPVELQQRYFRMIGVEEWTEIKRSLINSYRLVCGPAHCAAFEMVANKLQCQIRRGVSIYGQEGQKRKEQVFSLFYKILIVQAHRNKFGPSSLRPSRVNFGHQ